MVNAIHRPRTPRRSRDQVRVVTKAVGRTFNLVIRALPGCEAKAIRELRHVLKALLRRYDFRCVSVEEIPSRQTQGGENGEREKARA